MIPTTLLMQNLNDRKFSDSKMQKPSDVIEDAPPLYAFWSYKIHMATVKGEEFFHQ